MIRFEHVYNYSYVETAYLEIKKDPTAWGIIEFDTDTERKYVVIINDPDYASGVLVELYNDPEFAVLDIARDAEKRDARTDPTHWEIYEIDIKNKTAKLVQALAADPSLDGRWASPSYHWKETFGGAHKEDGSHTALCDLQKKKGKNSLQK